MFSLPATVPLEASPYGAEGFEGFEEDRACSNETGQTFHRQVKEITMAAPRIFVRGGRAASSRAVCSTRPNANSSSQLENT